MREYGIYYEEISKEGDYLENLMTLLNGGQNIIFHIDGLIINLEPGTQKADIEDRIIKTRQEFEQKHETVEKEDNESLLFFAKRLARMSKEQKSFFSAMYNSEQIVASPGCTDADILYQIVQINRRLFDNNLDSVEEMHARGGEDYIELGNRVYEQLKRGKNIKAYFNNIDMPFTKEMANRDGYVPSDAFTFASMINIMQGILRRQYEAFESAKENLNKKTISTSDIEGITSGINPDDKSIIDSMIREGEKDKNHDK